MIGHYLNTLLKEGFTFFSGHHQGLYLTKTQGGSEKGYRSPTLEKFQFSVYTTENMDTEEIYVEMSPPSLAQK